MNVLLDHEPHRPNPIVYLHYTPFCFPFALPSQQVKTLTEEATNRKALIESLKRRLNVATTEKSQYEASCIKLKEELEKKVGNSHAASSYQNCVTLKNVTLLFWLGAFFSTLLLAVCLSLCSAMVLCI